MTGVGAYFYIVWGIWLRHCLEGRADDVELVWPSVWSVPDVIRRPAEAKPAKVEITEA
jgi:dihydroceramidase